MVAESAVTIRKKNRWRSRRNDTCALPVFSLFFFLAVLHLFSFVVDETFWWESCADVFWFSHVISIIDGLSTTWRRRFLGGVFFFLSGLIFGKPILHPSLLLLMVAVPRSVYSFSSVQESPTHRPLWGCFRKIKRKIQ
jgi:hypothetical protein